MKSELVERLKKEILAMEGFCTPTVNSKVHFGIKTLEKAFPNHVFPTGAIHEMMCATPEDAAVSSGFAAALAGRIMNDGGMCLWLGQEISPPALRFFGIAPEKVLFVPPVEKQALWMIEEALKCRSLKVVIGEIKELNLTESRRLQLAVEESRVTGFFLRHNPRSLSNTAAVARWRVTALPSTETGIPGIGYYSWKVELLKVRNGIPGCWHIAWAPTGFAEQAAPVTHPSKAVHHIKTA
ncbi:MAG: hypothetical protein ABS46_02175 [Cytophagaceae bacterium SCN 52-12]|nr:MAG: hypothetical protein ABS46_02175 [Cytophagaceae bacterium SCN 52-12]